MGGAYGGYIVESKRYLQDYDSSRCWPQDRLPTDWVSEVLFDVNTEKVIKPSQSLDLLEGYRLTVKSADLKKSMLLLELRRNDEVVDSQVLLLKPYPTKNVCNTYYYRHDIMDLNGVAVQKKFPIIAVHFMSILSKDSAAKIDGIWQIKETLQQRCLIGFCPEGALCKDGKCVCPQNQILCKGKCVPEDNNNCGKLCITCSAIVNGVPGCLSGVCGVANCNTGYADCDKSAANGCETDLKSDNQSCGTCGKICVNEKTCCNGVCVDISANSYNCGGCNIICSTCGSCSDGNCIPQGDQIYVDRDHPNPTARKYPSIQEAIDHADNCSIINVPKGTYKENLKVIDKSLVIKGAGKNQTIIDGSGSYASVFNIKQDQKATNVILADMTIQNGKPNSGSGGGIHVSKYASLKVIDCIITRNSAANGGGICTDEDGGTLIVISCTIFSNYAAWDGGGIAARGNITVLDSIIKDNQANHCGGGIGFASNSKCDNTLEIMENSIVSGNIADKYGGGIFWDEGISGLAPLMDATSKVIDNYPDDILPPIYHEEQYQVKQQKKHLEDLVLSYPNWKDTFNPYLQ